MYDADFPPFRVIMGYLSSIVLSVVMILVLLRIILFLGAENSFAFWVLLFGFCIVIGCAGSQLAQVLFPARLQKCRVCSLIRKVIEIEWV
jgi:hypothetical protein